MQWKGLAVLAVTMLSGIVIGASLATLHFAGGRMPPGHDGPGRPSPQAAVEHLSDHLGLDRAQKERALEIFLAHEPEVQAARDRTKADMDALLEATAQDLEPALTPAQAGKLRALVERIKAGDMPPGFPPGPPLPGK